MTLRRDFARLPDAARLPLAARVAVTAGSLAPNEAGETLVAYVLDRRGGAILATSDARALWLAEPMFRAIGPGNFAPFDDQLAALVAGPILAKGGELAAIAWTARFAPRADDAIAVAVAALPPAAQVATLERLAAEVGPEPELLALATVQCGRVLAWSPHLLETPIAERIVGALLGLLDPARPKPLLELVARALGPLAAHGGALAARIRDTALAGIDALHRAAPTSFADEVAALNKPRMPELDRMRALPRREVAEACAYVLGFASPIDRAQFIAHRALVLDRPDADGLFDAFVDGLVAAAHVDAIAELVAAQLDTGNGAVLALAARLPLDPIVEVLVGELDATDPARRAAACAAVELLDDPTVDPALVVRLGDPSPDVAAAATRVLLARNRRDAIVEHAARETHPVRRAIAAASLGELDVDVIGELMRSTLDALAEAELTPIGQLIGDCLLGSIGGLETAANLIGGVPEAAAVLALAAVAASERDVGVLAPPSVRAHLATVTLGIATDPTTEPELATLALYLLARVSAGDATVADVIADALPIRDGYAGNLLAALGELRVATPRTASAIAALLAPTQPIGARVLAAVVSGRALPASHAAWQNVRELLELGTIARSAAWSALRDRARRA